MSAKILFREGISPDRQLRIVNLFKYQKEGYKNKAIGRLAWKQLSFNESVKAH